MVSISCGNATKFCVGDSCIDLVLHLGKNSQEFSSEIIWKMVSQSINDQFIDINSVCCNYSNWDVCSFERTETG